MQHSSPDVQPASPLLDAAAAMTEAPELTTLAQRLAVRSRPPLRPAMYQSWRELLFLHWRVSVEAVQMTLPPGLVVDPFQGAAWIGIVPFFMRRIRPWWAPSVPGLSNFQELNCRTYVVDRHGTPGVWFYSLDANSRLAVWWARTFFHLPYHVARMSHTWDRQSGRIEFISRRRGAPRGERDRFVYQPIGRPSTSTPGTLEFFLVERYVLFADCGSGRLMRGIVHHTPYQVSAAQVDVAETVLFSANNLPHPHGPPDHALISPGVDVEVFSLQPVPS